MHEETPETPLEPETPPAFEAPEPHEGDEAESEETPEPGQDPSPEHGEPEPGEETPPTGDPAAPEASANGHAASGGLELAQLEELEKAETNYKRRVSKALAPLPLPPDCEVCNGTGLNFGPPADEPQLRPSPTVEMCPDCDGWGKVTTGSKAFGEDVLPCPSCSGAGHRPRLPALGEQLEPAPARVGDRQPAWMGDPTLA